MKVRIAREGYPFILISWVIAAVVLIFAGWKAFFGVLILPLFVTAFFRDPERVIPEEPGLVVAPADGRVLSIREVEETRYLKKKLRCISIFMSVVNVHVNRAPVPGRVKSVQYHPGKFLIGFAEKASWDNEQNAVILETPQGEDVVCVQIAGMVARRIVCYVKEGDQVSRGERFGMIRFGSRVDVYLPLDAEVWVEKGAIVKAGETVLGRMRLRGDV